MEFSFHFCLSDAGFAKSIAERHVNDRQESPPKDFPTLRTAIAQRAGELPKRLMQVAGYALDNPDDIAFGTVASIAASADVQPSALVRFSRALGYQGFTDLQDVFRSRLRDRVLNYDERLAQMREHGIATSKSGLVLDGFLEATRAIDRALPREGRPRGDRPRRRHPGGRQDHLSHRPQALVPGHLLHELRHGQAVDPQHPGRRGGRLGAEQASFITADDAAVGDQLRALCQRDGGADGKRQGARRKDRHRHRFGVLADRLAGRCDDRGQRGEFRRLPLDGGDHGDCHDAVGGGGRRDGAKAKPPAALPANPRRRAPAGRSR